MQTVPETDYWGLPDPDTQAEFYADVPTKRFVAFVIDTVLVALITLVAIPFTAFTALFFLPVLWMVISVAYRIVTLAGGSATWGMRLTGIEIRSASGQKLDLGLAFAHTVLYAVFFSMFIPQVVSIVLMLTGARGQGLHDHILGTAAINRAAQR